MKELVVISGKGGTGKTSLMAAFASLAEKKVLCDADVDAADLHLLMDPDIKERHDFQGGSTAIINPNNCTQCGLCRDLCRWNAISEAFEVDPIECEGCGVCVDFCPEEAIDFPIKTCGEWFISNTRFGPMVHARLGIAEENSGKLVALVRQEAKKLAEKNKLDLLITDGPPGVGCPVIASLGGASAVLVVAEPTVSGLHDMERVAQLAAHFKVPGMVCVNKFDLNFDQTEAIEKLAKENKMTVVGRVPFDPVFTESMVKGQTVLEYVGNSKFRSSISEIWQNIRNQLVL
ncbi:MAG: P-loop NTPase [Desulfobacteraceae bacterium]|nr:P-loop NTPase [Desulfobacteraceae bacterium]MDH3719869.1 P-loop NTPase [Desulfobacteraceae bacterium]MDH3956225.1 P-loop NTPase [Desulfobacteraceae bacterium]